MFLNREYSHAPTTLSGGRGKITGLVGGKKAEKVGSCGLIMFTVSGVVLKERG